MLEVKFSAAMFLSISFVLFCDVSPCCILAPGESQARGHRRTFAGILPYPSGCCLVLLLSVDNVPSSRTLSSLGTVAAT